jgi:hypothetical protein
VASFDELVKKKIALFEATPENLATDAVKVQLKVWRELAPLLNSFDVDSDGNILQTDDNIKRIGAIGERLNKLLAGAEYQDAVKSFLNGIDEGIQLTNDIAKKFDQSFEPTSAQKALLQLTKANAIDAFIGSGLRNRVTLPFLEQLTSNVAARAPLREAVKSLETVLLGTDKADGRLLANIKTTATTAQAISDRAYSVVVAEKLDIQFFRYAGGEIPTTRPFCQHREGAVFHRGEIEAWGNGQNSGGMNDIKGGTWAGEIDGTDSKSIFTFLGGWNCRHVLIPLELKRVPPEVIARATAEGFMETKVQNQNLS